MGTKPRYLDRAPGAKCPGRAVCLRLAIGAATREAPGGAGEAALQPSQRAGRHTGWASHWLGVTFAVPGGES